MSHAFLVASNIRIGRTETAVRAAERLVEIAPGFTVSSVVQAGLWRQPLTDYLADSLREAGIPE
jgi:hypothetical protein